MIPLLDTHQHMIYPARMAYPIAETVPALAGQAFTYEDYCREVEGQGVIATLFMETTSADAEEEFALGEEVAHRPGSLVRGSIASFAMEAALPLEAWIVRRLPKGLCGIRRICHTEADDFATACTFVRNVRTLGTFGLPFDLCFLSRQLPRALCLAEQCPGTIFVLDHCGIPDIASGEWDDWCASVSRLAALPHVRCKISGLLAYCRAGEATIDKIRPYVQHCIAVFGWDRVLWGSDWPFCNQKTTAARWIAMTRDLVRDEPEEHQRKLFYRNARQVYKRADGVEDLA